MCLLFPRGVMALCPGPEDVMTARPGRQGDTVVYSGHEVVMSMCPTPKGVVLMCCCPKDATAVRPGPEDAMAAFLGPWWCHGLLTWS